MKFSANTVFEVSDDYILEIVNSQQEWDELEVFDFLDEVPMELVWRALDMIDFFEEELSCRLAEDLIKVEKI